MKINKGSVKLESLRDLYWVTVDYISDDDNIKTKLLAGSTEEYLTHFLKLKNNDKLTTEKINQWLDVVVNKWSNLGKSIFNQDVHYDFYANSTQGESDGLNFLMNKIK